MADRMPGATVGFKAPNCSCNWRSSRTFWSRLRLMATLSECWPSKARIVVLPDRDCGRGLTWPRPYGPKHHFSSTYDRVLRCRMRRDYAADAGIVGNPDNLPDGNEPGPLIELQRLGMVERAGIDG